MAPPRSPALRFASAARPDATYCISASRSLAARLARWPSSVSSASPRSSSMAGTKKKLVRTRR